MLRRQITLSKVDKICPLAIPNQISFISMHVPSLVKIRWHLLKLSSRNGNMGLSRADNSIKIWRNLPISNPKPDLHKISMHIRSLVKIHWSLLKLSSRNKNMGVSRAVNSVKIWRKLPISNPKLDLHNMNARTKFGENPLSFTQVIIRKRNTDGQTHGHQAWNHNTTPLSCGGV